MATSIEEYEREEAEDHEGLEVLIIDNLPCERFETTGENAHHEVRPIIEGVPSLQRYDPARQLDSVCEVIENEWGDKGYGEKDVERDITAGFPYY